MDITQPISGLPALAMPYEVLKPVAFGALNMTPFKHLMGADSENCPLVLHFAKPGMSTMDWTFSPDSDETNVATGHQPFETAVDTKSYAVERISIDKIKWMATDRYQDFQKIASPVESPERVILKLAHRKFAKRWPIEIIGGLTFGSTAFPSGVTGRYDVNANGSMPVEGRCYLGPQTNGTKNTYTPVDNATFRTRIDALLGGTTSVMSVKFVRDMHNIATGTGPQHDLKPVRKFIGENFDERQILPWFMSAHQVEQLEDDIDFKVQNYQRGVVIPGQANPTESNNFVARIADFEIIKCKELDKYTSFTINGHTYDHGFILGADALRLMQQEGGDGMEVTTNLGLFDAKKEERVTTLLSYWRGYKCPAYWNKVTGALNDSKTTNTALLAENGVIHIITRRS